MSDQNPAETPTTTTDDSGETRPPGRLARWRQAARDRAGRVRKGVALAVAAALLLGGAGGFALGALVSDGGHGHGPGDRGRWSDHPRRFDGDRQGPPPGVPGQLPPATREEDSGLDG